MRKIEELLDHTKTYSVALEVRNPFVVNPDTVMIGGEKYVKIDKVLELIKERHIKNYVQYDNSQSDGWEDASLTEVCICLLHISNALWYLNEKDGEKCS